MKASSNLYTSSILFSAGLFLVSSCDIGDGLRNWGSRHREKRTQQISATELEMWKRDLALSEEKALEMHENMQALVSERKLQGQLSWKIGKALMAESRFEAAADYYKAAVNGELPEGESHSGQVAKAESAIFEEALPHFKRALKLHVIDPELLFDAGLCYANASRTMGWEEDRFRTALFLLERGLTLKPSDGRFLYQLALLYGKTENRYRDTDRALELLDALLKREDANIPARFARANILAETGDLQGAFDENLRITEKVKQLFESNKVRGDYRQNSQFRSAEHNMEQLQLCIEGKPECTLKSVK